MIDYRIPRVTAVRHVRDNILWLRFSDGLEGEVDLADDLRGEWLESLRPPDVFAHVKIEYGTLVWPNGVDWAPEALHDRVLAANGPTSRSVGDTERQPRYFAGMPGISHFYGIVIRMLANDHAPHFYAQ